MKKILDKKLIIGFTIGIISMGGIGVAAASYLYNSNQISYGDTNVKVAIDELYNRTIIPDKTLVATKLGSVYTVGLSGTSTTVDLSSFTGYQEFEYGKNIFVVPNIVQDGNGNIQRSFSYSYNNSTGKLTVTVSGSSITFLYFSVYVVTLQ